MDQLSLLPHLLNAIPMFIVWVVAVSFAVARWNQHPNVSLLVVVAVAIFFLSRVANAMFTSSLLARQREVDFAYTMMLMNGLMTVAQVLGFSLLIGAVFGWRKRVT